MKKWMTILIGVSAIAAMNACSSGGNGGNGDPEVGTFVDSAVEGLRYEGPNFAGTTNAAGEYDYEPGDEVCFYLGDIELGCPEGKGIVTPIDLFDDVNPDDDQVINVVRLLMSLDEDGDPDNGIDVSNVETDETHAGIDFDQNEATFAADGLVSDLVVNEGHDGTLPSASDAEEHFEGSLEDNDYWEQNLLGDFILALDGSFGDTDFDVIQFTTPTFSEDDIEDHSMDADEEEVSFEYDLGAETCTLSGDYDFEQVVEGGATMLSIEGDLDCVSFEGSSADFRLYGLPSDVAFDDADLVPGGGYYWEFYITFGSAGGTVTYDHSALPDIADAVNRNASIDASGAVQLDASDGEIGFDCTLSGQMIATKDEIYGEADCTGQFTNGHFRAVRVFAAF